MSCQQLAKFLCFWGASFLIAPHANTMSPLKKISQNARSISSTPLRKAFEHPKARVITNVGLFIPLTLTVNQNCDSGKDTVRPLLKAFKQLHHVSSLHPACRSLTLPQDCAHHFYSALESAGIRQIQYESEQHGLNFILPSPLDESIKIPFTLHGANLKLPGVMEGTIQCYAKEDPFKDGSIASIYGELFYNLLKKYNDAQG